MPGWGPAKDSGGGSEETFSSSLLFRHAAFGFRFLSVEKSMEDLGLTQGFWCGAVMLCFCGSAHPLRFYLAEQEPRAGKCTLLQFISSGRVNLHLSAWGSCVGALQSKKVGKANICCLVARSHSPLFQPPGLQPARLLCPWDAPHKETGVGCHVPLQGIFPTQGSNPHLLPWQAESLPRATWEAPGKDAELGLLRGPRETSVPAVRKFLGRHYRGKGSCLVGFRVTKTRKRPCDVEGCLGLDSWAPP